MDDKEEFQKTPQRSPQNSRYHPPSQDFQKKHKSNSILSKRAKFGLMVDQDNDSSSGAYNNEVQRQSDNDIRMSEEALGDSG